MVRLCKLSLALACLAGCGGTDVGSVPDAPLAHIDAVIPTIDAVIHAPDAVTIDAPVIDAPVIDAPVAVDALVPDAPVPDAPVPDATPPSPCSGATASVGTTATVPTTPALTLPGGFVLQGLASVNNARELAALPNGDLLVGTENALVYIVPGAERDGAPFAPQVFMTINDSPTQGITFDAATCTIYVASQHGVYAIPYVDGQLSGGARNPIASVRSGIVAPNSDGDIHTTSSVTVSGSTVYVGVGSSCNACVEVDPTRATIQAMNLDGSGMATRATRIRNAIALATNPATGTVWAGGAGQDSLPVGHPYEYFDALTLHPGVADYGWPDCEENHVAYVAGSDCTATIAPIVELPAYSTIIGAVFYPTNQTGTHAFPAANRGLYLAGHGSWHETNGVFDTAPRVAFVPMNGDAPVTAVNWSDPTKQWTEFLGGCENAAGTARTARPTGIAVGAQGSLFVADDQNGKVYRIRPQ